MASAIRNQPTVLVTSIMNDGGVYAARALVRGGYNVLSSDFGQLPWAFRPRYARLHETLSGSTREQFEQQFLDLIRRHKPAAMLNFGTTFTRASILHRATIENTTAFLAPQLDAFLAAYEKSRCMRECAGLGIPVPRTFSIEEAREFLDLAQLRGAPETLVVKPDLDVGGGRGFHCVRSCAELDEQFQHCRERFGDALIQEFIPGDVTAMKSVMVLFDRNGKLDAAFTTQKIRQWPQTGGCAALSISTADAELVHQVLPFFEKHPWQGAAEVELKYDARDRRHKVIEINPRVPAYMRFADLCGWDLPVRTVELAMGRRASSNPSLSFRPGQGYCRPGFFLPTCVDDLRRRGLIPAVRQAWTDWRRVRPSVRDSLRDLLPMVGRVIQQFPHANGLPALSSQQDANWLPWHGTRKTETALESSGSVQSFTR